MYKISKEKVLEITNSETIFLCYNGRITEYVIPKKIKEKLFLKDRKSRLKELNIYVNGKKVKLDLNYKTKSFDYRTGFIKNNYNTDKSQVVEIVASEIEILNHIEIRREDTREIFQNFSNPNVEIRNEALLKLKEKGFRVLENELKIEEDIESIFKYNKYGDEIYVYKSDKVTLKKLNKEKMVLFFRFNQSFKDGDKKLEEQILSLKIFFKSDNFFYSNIKYKKGKNSNLFVFKNSYLVSNSKDYIIEKNLEKLKEYKNYWENQSNKLKVCKF